MSVDYRYFRVTSGVLAERAAEIQRLRTAAAEKITAFSKEVGGTGFYESRNGLAGFMFDSPDRRYWKEVHSGFWPKRNIAAGRAFIRRIQELPKLMPLASALESVGLTHNLPVVASGRTGYCCSLTGCHERGIWFVLVPWAHESAEDKAQYEIDRKRGKRWSLYLEHLRWTPPADWVEIKGWEVEREIEEINAARRAPAVPA